MGLGKVKKRINYDLPYSYESYTNNTLTSKGSGRSIGVASVVTANTMYPIVMRQRSRGNKMQLARKMDLGSGGFYSYQPYAYHPKSFSGIVKRGIYEYRGPLFAAIPPSDVLTSTTASGRGIPGPEYNAMVAKGVNAIAQLNPLNPVANGAVALAELRNDGLPKLQGLSLLENTRDGKSLLRSFGEEHLNTQFATAPLLGDLASVLEASRKSEKIISQLKRDSGQWVRRRKVFPPETSTTVVVQRGTAYGPIPTMATPLYKDTNFVKTTTTTVTRRYSFSGAFTYYIPTDETFSGILANETLEARKLYGLQPSLEVAWNMKPWTWAVDWFGNAGKNITNLTRFAEDGLIMPYGYVMCETTYDVVVTISGVKTYSFAGDLETRYGYKSKSRIRAIPFGFGLNESSLSARQWSIIGALGLTKAPGKLF